MYSSAPSFDSSLVLNDPGSSSTSPSRFPRILVEYQPSSPSMRALNAGASTVFIMVWPVLKSLPQIATLCSIARCWMAGMSTVRFGAPLANGTPLVTEAHAYSIDGAIDGSLAFMASTNFAREQRTSSGLMNTSVEPQQQVTSRDK